MTDADADREEMDPAEVVPTDNASGGPVDVEELERLEREATEED